MLALTAAIAAASYKSTAFVEGSLAGSVVPFLVPCILVPCAHGLVVAAGFLPSRLSIRLCTDEACARNALPWWEQAAWLAVCPHGLVSTTISLDGLCDSDLCYQCANAHCEAAQFSIPELPATDDPIRWPREWRFNSLDAADIFQLATSVHFTFVSLFEHTAAFRAAFSPLVRLVASVADRPTALPPTSNAVHFIADVLQWLDSYPHTLPFVTANPSCVAATVAAVNSCRSRLLRNMQNGTALSSLRDQTAVLECATHVALEQPPSFFEFALGPPSVVTSVAAYGCPWRKQWLWWLSAGVPVVPPSVADVDPDLPSIHHSLDDLLDRDLRAIARAPTPYDFARQHAAVWAPIASAADAPAVLRDRSALLDRAHARFADAHARLMLAAAALLCPRLPVVPSFSVVVLLPYHRANAAPCFLLPSEGFLGRELKTGVDPVHVARDLATSLTITTEPCVVHSTESNGLRTFLFAVPSPVPPPSDNSLNLPASWHDELSLADTPRRLYVSLAARRVWHLFFAVEGDLAHIGTSGPPVPLDDSPEARAWQRQPASRQADEQWRDFLRNDAERAQSLAAAMRSIDRGDGSMKQWAITTRSAADIAHELEVPPQGVPFIPDNLLFAILPDIYIDSPAPLTTQMLVRLPPQAWPPDCPLPTRAEQLFRPWFVRMLFATTKQLGEREAWCFAHPIAVHATAAQVDAWIASAPPKPPELLVGDGAYYVWTYNDGLSWFPLNAYLFDIEADGRVFLTDVTREHFTPWFLDRLRERFDPGDQLELLSHAFRGVQSKASCPRQVRIAVNMDGLLTHVRAVADDLSKLTESGLYKVRPLVWLTGPLADIDSGDAHVWPIASSPTWTSPVNAIHKKHSATEKRRLANGSWPYNLPRVREQPHGEPDGPPAIDFNTLVGPMRPPVGTPIVDTPFELTALGSPCDGCGSVVVSCHAQGRHAWWGALFCLACWGASAYLRFEPLKWHKELKHTPKTVMQAAAPLRYLAQQSNEYVYAITTDWRVWFWQFGLNPWELWTAHFFAIVRVGDYYAFCLVGELVANMGRSHVSNVASAVGSRLYEPIRKAADAREQRLAALDPPELQRLVDQRRAQLGHDQARLFWCGCYTDDGLSLAVGALRAAYIARDIMEQNKKVGIWMASFDKCPVGTVADHIGGRFIFNAGLSTLTPDKRLRTLHGCRSMVRAELTCAQFESEHGLFWHVADLLAIERPLLNGLGRMLAFARQRHMSHVILTADGLSRVLELEYLVASRPYACIAAAVATVVLQPLHSPSSPSVIISSDSCTGMFDPVTGALDPLGAPDPAIFVHAGSLATRIRLVGAWRLLHITVTETLGPAVGAIALAPSFPFSPLLAQTDASAALAFLKGRSQSECLQRIYSRWRQERCVADFLLRTSAQLTSGIGNVVDDAGSRGYWDVLHAYTSACGIRLSLLEPPAAAVAFLADALLIALDYTKQEPPRLQANDIRDLHTADAGTLSDVLARAAYHRIDASSSPAGYATGLPPRLAAAVIHDTCLPRPIPLHPSPAHPHHGFDSTLGYPGEGPPPPASPPSPPRHSLALDSLSRHIRSVRSKQQQLAPNAAQARVKRELSPTPAAAAETRDAPAFVLHRPVAILYPSRDVPSMADVRAHVLAAHAHQHTDTTLEADPVAPRDVPSLAGVSMAEIRGHVLAAHAHQHTDTALDADPVAPRDVPSLAGVSMAEIRGHVPDTRQPAHAAIQGDPTAPPVHQVARTAVEIEAVPFVPVLGQHAHAAEGADPIVPPAGPRSNAAIALSLAIDAADSTRQQLPALAEMVDALRRDAHARLRRGLLEAAVNEILRKRAEEPGMRALYAVALYNVRRDVWKETLQARAFDSSKTVPERTWRQYQGAWRSYVNGELSRELLAQQRAAPRTHVHRAAAACALAHMAADVPTTTWPPTLRSTSPPISAPPSPPSSPTLLRAPRSSTPLHAPASPQPVPLSWSSGHGDNTPVPSRSPSPSSPQMRPTPQSRSASSSGAEGSGAYASPSLPQQRRHRTLRRASPQPLQLYAPPIAPRPATARAARALATQSMADAIAADASRYALCPGDPARARALVHRVRDTQADARAASTQRGDNWGYTWYIDGCNDLGCDPVRPSDVLDARRESILGGHVVMNAAAKMQPRDRTRAAADPSSAWTAYKKARVVLADLGCLLPPLDDVRDVLRGLLRDFVRRYGDLVLVTEKKQPYHRSHETVIESWLRQRAMDAFWFNSDLDFMLWVIVCFLRNIGARGAELCKNDLYFTRSNVFPMLRNAVLEPTAANFVRATRVRVTPTGSKCDFTNKHWGAHPMYFDIEPGAHLNLGHALQQLELKYPCEVSERGSFPLVFDPDKYRGGVPSPVSKSWLDARHSALLLATIGASAASQRTVHSWRVTLGCSLRAAKDAEHPDGRPLELVKAFGRWRSDQAVAGYARLSADAYAAHIRASLAADAGAVPAPALDDVMRAVDPIDMLENIQGAISSGAAAKAPSLTAPSGGTDAALLAQAKQQLAPRKRAASPAPAPPSRRSTAATAPVSARAASPATAPSPLVAASAKGRQVLVPASLWPDHICGENGGIGWSAVILKVARGAAAVRFSSLRHANGRRDYNTYHLQLDVLEPV